MSVPRNGIGEQRAALPPDAAALFRTFLGLGLTGFGGPMAHLAMFRRVLVGERAWIAPERYDALVALAQLVPGPASSQVGFALGLHWAGWRGALAAFVGFTLPSALLMTALGLGLAAGMERDAVEAVLRGLMLTAVAVIAHAVVVMLKGTRGRALPLVAALVVAVVALLAPIGLAVWLALLAAAAVGALWPDGVSEKATPWDASPSHRSAARVALVALGVAWLVVIGAMHIANDVPPALAVAAANLQAGALVFGGGHVVLPLLQAGTVTPGWVSPDAFATGYGAAQALPGPMFAFSAYLGAMAQPGAWAPLSALLSLLAIFLPGFVFIVAAQAYSQRLLSTPRGLAALGMVNAAVIGLLAAAWWDLAREVRVGLVDVPVLVVAFGLLWRHPRGALWAAVSCVAYAGATPMLFG